MEIGFRTRSQHILILPSSTWIEPQTCAPGDHLLPNQRKNRWKNHLNQRSKKSLWKLLKKQYFPEPSMLVNSSGQNRIARLTENGCDALQRMIYTDIQVPAASLEVDTSWVRVSRGVTHLPRQTGEFPPEVEGVDVSSLKRGASVAPLQPEDPKPGVGRPTAAPSQTTPITTRPIAGQRNSARPCIGGPIPANEKDNSDPLSIPIGERPRYVVGYSERNSHTNKRSVRSAECPRRWRRLSMVLSHT